MILPRQASTAGFTLIEILVVMIIVGVVMSMAVLSFGESDANRVTRESDRLALLMEAASDEAISSGVTLGWSPTENGYRFWRYDDAAASWRDIENNDTLRPRTLPEAMQISEVKVNLAPLKKDDKLRFNPSGVNAPFTLIIRQGDGARQLVADVMGRIEQTVQVPNAKP